MVAVPRTLSGAEPAWHLYVVRTEAPDALGEALRERGIGARSYYRTPIHEQPAMRGFAPDYALPGTDRAAATNLAIPMHPALSDEQIAEVVEAVRQARRG